MTEAHTSAHVVGSIWIDLIRSDPSELFHIPRFLVRQSIYSTTFLQRTFVAYVFAPQSTAIYRQVTIGKPLLASRYRLVSEKLHEGAA